MPDRADLVFRRNLAVHAPAAHRAFLAEVFGAEVFGAEVFGETPAPEPPLAPRWTAAGYLDAGGRCVAAAEIAALSLVAGGGEPVRAAAVRLVGVADAWRGQGLFRALMEDALRQCGDLNADLVLLYTADHDLYRRFGFEPVAQHAVVGTPPAAVSGVAGRRLDPRRDAALIRRVVSRRAPVSRQVAVVEAPGLFLDRIGDIDFALSYRPDLEAIIVWEEDADMLVLADVVAASMPGMGAAIDGLPRHATLKTLFPPDQLGWAGAPLAEDTGLMARGALPAALRRPFMLPPTAEF